MIPITKIDKTKWPADVREISIAEQDAIGIDKTGRLYWNGKPVEIVGQRLDLTKAQFAVAILVAIFTGIAAIATAIQAWSAYYDFACKAHWAVAARCPPVSDANGPGTAK